MVRLEDLVLLCPLKNTTKETFRHEAIRTRDDLQSQATSEIPSGNVRATQARQEYRAEVSVVVGEWEGSESCPFVTHSRRGDFRPESYIGCALCQPTQAL